MQLDTKGKPAEKQPVQLIIDAYGCKGELDSETKILDMLIDAATAIGANIVKKDAHTYEPQGISATLILAESHMSIHTWPEIKYCTVDIFFCNPDMSPETSWNIIKKFLVPDMIKTHKITHQINEKYSEDYV
jgi:S-adenosylmethionine decarboxylase